jgi:hypothetical protein
VAGFSSKTTLPKLQRTDQLKATYATILGYGPARGGKTRSIEECYRQGLCPVVIVTELGETHGLLSLASTAIPYLVVHSHAEIIEVIAELRAKPGAVSYPVGEGEAPPGYRVENDRMFFGMVVLDSITQWGEWPLERFVEIKGWGDLATPATSKDPRSAYGFLAEKGRQLYKELFSLHAHLFIIAREGLFGGEGDVASFAAPELPGQKLPRELPGWPDATVRLRVIAGAYRMITQGEGNTPAGIRIPSSFKALPARCNNNIPALIRYMTGDQSAYSLLVPEVPKKTTTLSTATAATAASSTTEKK